MIFMMGCYTSVMGTGGSGWGGEAEFSKYDTPPTKGVSPDADDMHSGANLAAKNRKYGNSNSSGYSTSSANDDCVQLFDEEGLDPDDDEDNGGYTKRRMGGGGGGGQHQHHHHQHQKSSPPKGQGSSANSTPSPKSERQLHFQQQQRQLQQLQERQSRKVEEEADEVQMFEEQIRDKHLHLHGNVGTDKVEVTPTKVMTAEGELSNAIIALVSLSQYHHKRCLLYYFNCSMAEISGERCRWWRRPWQK